MTALLSLLLLLATEPKAAPPALEPRPIATNLDERVVVASGLTPRSETVMLALGREIRGLSCGQLVPQSGHLLADAMGSARFVLTRPLPQRSLWVVIDKATGRLAVGSPEGAQAPDPPYTQVSRRSRAQPQDLCRGLIFDRAQRRSARFPAGVSGRRPNPGDRPPTPHLQSARAALRRRQCAQPAKAARSGWRLDILPSPSFSVIHALML